MTTAAHQAPFQWLQALDKKIRAYNVSLPKNDIAEKILWQGIAFKLKNQLMVSWLPDVKEVLYYPKTLAKVPGSKPWVLGIANHKGILIPVIDLNACLGNTILKLNQRSRLLIINHAGITAGLLVSEVYGIKYFSENSKRILAKDDLETINYQTFVQEYFELNGQIWSIFDMCKLSESHFFLHAGS